MLRLMRKHPGLSGLIVLCPLLGACAQQPVLEGTTRQTQRAAPVDFSGSWEIDFTRSDDVQQELTELFRNMSRAAQNRASQGSSRSVDTNIGISAGVAESIVAIARLADSITRSPVLEIEQSANGIEVNRQDDFALSCAFAAQRVETAFGAELCGWFGEQMVFHVSLPDGLTVSHRMTIAPDRQKLHIATTVASSAAPTPFTLSRFYDRFEPLPSDYECEYTLSKRKVCKPRRSDQ